MKILFSKDSLKAVTKDFKEVFKSGHYTFMVGQEEGHYLVVLITKGGDCILIQRKLVSEGYKFFSVGNVEIRPPHLSICWNPSLLKTTGCNVIQKSDSVLELIRSKLGQNLV